MFLLDTVTLSDLAKRHGDPGARTWLRAQSPASVFVSVIALGEIERGIVAKARKDSAAAEVLQRWFDDLLWLYQDRILPVTTAIARRWGQLSARIGHPGIDLLIAATALDHDLTVVTRNLRDFRPTGVSIVNPFTSAQRP